MKICFFDLETRKRPEELGHEKAGWDALKRGEGGISALAIFDTEQDWCFVYDDHNIQDIAIHLESADLVVGWNSKDFDVPCVEGILGRKLVLKEHIDICEIVKNAVLAAGMQLRKGENKLGSVCDRTLGRKKLEDGALAPDLAKEGKWGRLFNYCCDDVRLTRDLYKHLLTEGGFISAASTFIPVPPLPFRMP